MFRTSAPLSVVGLLLGSCASPRAEAPDLPRRVEELALPVPESWSEGRGVAGEVSAEPFWTPFGEAALDALIQEALQHNRDLAASAARLAAAAARSAVARSVRWPSLDANLGASRTKNVFVGLPIPGSDGPLSAQFNRFDVGLQATWELDLWGRLAASAASADAALAASAAELSAARLAVAAEVSRAWFQAREAALQVALATRTTETYRDTLKVIEDRFAAGLVGALDVRLARANVASSEASRTAAERLAASAARRIELVLGRYPAGEIETPGPFAELPPPVPAGLPVELLGRRPDLAALERQLVAAEAAVRERKADRWPRLALTGSAGRTSDEVEDLLDGDFTIWALASSLTAPLFDAGRRAAAVDEAEANVIAAGQAFAGGVLTAFAEVENALDAEVRLREGLGHLTTAVEEAREALALADAQYREGLIGIELVLDAQRRLLIAESASLGTQRELFVNRVDLVVALGGGFGGAAEGEPGADGAGDGEAAAAALGGAPSASVAAR